MRQNTEASPRAAEACCCDGDGCGTGRAPALLSNGKRWEDRVWHPPAGLATGHRLCARLFRSSLAVVWIWYLPPMACDAGWKSPLSGLATRTRSDRRNRLTFLILEGSASSFAANRRGAGGIQEELLT